MPDDAQSHIAHSTAWVHLHVRWLWCRVSQQVIPTHPPTHPHPPLLAECHTTLQAVYELYEVFPTTAWEPDAARESVVVIIGRNLKREVLTKWLEDCAA